MFFLDISKAFDKVWRNCLSVKLSKMDVSGNNCSIINECHTNTTSAAVVNQTHLKGFPCHKVHDKVEFCQRTYILCISKNLLERSCTINRIFSIISNCPSFAVNIAALQRMLYVSYEYSWKWHFSFNAQKVCILQVRSKGSELDFDCIWKLGDTIIRAPQGTASVCK